MPLYCNDGAALRVAPVKGPDPKLPNESGLKCPFLKSEMRAVLMMVTSIFREQSLQMVFIQCNHVGSSRSLLQLPTQPSAMPR